MDQYGEQQYTVPPVGMPSDAPPATYSGNRTDNTAALAMLAGVGMVISSCTIVGGCAFPIFALVAGIIGLRNAGQAINPSRTRTYAWIGIATGGILLLLLIGVVVLYGALIFSSISQLQELEP